MLVYPDIDPVALALGPLKIRWYGLMYVLGFVGGWFLARRRAASPRSTWTPADVDDLIFYAALGVIAGGRLGWILFYGFDTLRADPLALVKVWQGGMACHGGRSGVLVAIALFARRRGRSVGLGAGRIGNFINGELWGKSTDVPWGFLVDGEVRHASQLYESLLEGLVLFLVLWWFTSRPRPQLAPSGLFLLLYGTFRFLIEFVRLPDADIGYLAFGWLTMGQLLSLPMIVAGFAMLAWASSTRRPSGNYA